MSVDSVASDAADANAECLHVANALFANDVKPEFTAALQSRMGATALALTSAADVNAWCETQTRGAIPRIIDDGAISPQTAMLLVNALLFRGKWKFAFNPFETCHGVWNWNSADGAKPRVQYMNRHFEDEREHLYAGIVGSFGSAREARVVRVPYTAPGIEAWFILPVASGASALAAVGNALPQLWHQINALSRLGRHRRPVYLTCPRFDISTSIENVVKRHGQSTRVHHRYRAARHVCR